ncbi:MAG: hypothetical protein C4576_02735, partial [Desulfobacteraceae bacterium]
MDKASKLLVGAIDLHLHSGPGMISRKLDHCEAARQSIEAGVKGIVLKDHHYATVGAAYMINNYIFKDAPIEVYGALCLNNAVGGLSPFTVDSAIKYGAKVIWFPTVSALNHIESHRKHAKKGFPTVREKLLPEKPLRILDDEGKLLPQVSEICELIANSDVILGTGHLSVQEIRLLIDEARSKGIQKIMVDHPEFMVNATLEEMVEFADKGAMIEHTCVIALNSMSTEHLVQMIRSVGAERTVINSDLGQTDQLYPVEGLKKLITNLLDAGIKEGEIELMFRRNQE